jgi:hypothetical protein
VVGVSSIDIRLEVIRKTAKSIPGIAKVFIELLKNSNKEIALTSAKLLANLTEGAGITL